MKFEKKMRNLLFFSTLLISNYVFGLTATITTSAQTFEGMFSGATLTVSNGSTALTGSATGAKWDWTNANIGDVVYALVSSSWVRVGTLQSVPGSKSSATLTSAYTGTSITTAANYVIIPKSGTITVDDVTLTISFATGTISDSMICSVALGTTVGGGKPGLIVMNHSTMHFIPLGVTVNGGTGNNITLTSGFLRWRSNVSSSPPVNCTYTYNGGTVIFYPFGGTVGGPFNLFGSSFSSLTIEATSTTRYVAQSAMTIAGVLTIPSSGTLDMGTFSLTNTGTISNSGTLKTSTTTNPAFSTTSSSVGIVEFAATAGGQFIPSKSYTTLTLSNTSSTNTALGAISVTNPLTVGSNTTLDMSTFGLTLTGAITNNGTLKTSSTSNPPFTTTSTSISGTVQFAASTGGQFVPAVTYNNLSLTNSSGSQTLKGNTRIQGTLTISSGGKLNTNGFSIPAVNAFSGTGQITGGSSFRMNITGSSAGTFYMDQATPLTTNRVKYLGLAANATATLGNKTVVYGDTSYSGNVDLKSGSVLTSNTTNTNAALLEFRYGTAGDYHGVLGMNGGSLVGEALVEDYFVSGFRAFRQTGHVLDSALSLNQITDDFDLFGTISSGSSGRGSAGNKDGLYAATSTAKNSVFTYKEDVSSGSKWLPFTATSSNSTILPGTGIMFVMRPTGSGESGNYNAQIMDYEGAVNQRRRAISVLKNSGTGTFGYNLLANPYAAYLNFDRFIDTNNAMLAATGFFKYDESIKNYTTHSKSGGQWFKNSNAFSVNTANLDPGDAFWVRVSSAGTVYMNPNMTTYNKSNDVSKGNKLEIDTTIFSTLGIKLKSSSDSTIGDEATILSASWGGDMSYKNGDMSNMKGTCIDISVVSSDKEALAFKTLDITKSWLIPLNVQACASGSYSFSFDITANKTGYETEYELLDKYLNKSTKIVSGNTLIFQITSDSASMGGSRFYLNAVPSKLLSTESLKSEQIVTTFPNPISKNDVLKINVSQGKSLQIQLINAMGQKLYSIENVAAGKIMEIDLTSLQLSQGIYYLNSTRDNKTETQRVIIY